MSGPTPEAPAARDAAPPAEPGPPARPVRQLLAAGAGHFVEAYDWYLYGYLAVYFAARVFPSSSGDSLVPLLDSFAVFALAFAARPIGALVMGRYADRSGRRATLTVTISLMGLGSLLMGLAPDYRSAGLLAPLLVVVGRLLQGFSLGGEYAAASVFLLESARPDRRALFTSFQYVAATAGHIVAGLLVVAAAHATDDSMGTWGWRLPLIAGALLSAVGLWLRRGARETHRAVPEARRPAPGGMFAGVRRYPVASLLVFGLTVGGTVGYYVWTSFLPVYAQLTVHADKADAVLSGTLSLVVFGVLQPFAGALSDRIGRRPMLVAFGVLSVFGTVPLLGMLSGSFWNLVLVQSLGMLAVTPYTAVAGAAVAELFPADYRARGTGLPYAAAVALFGGTAPYVGTWFKAAGRTDAFPWYIAVLGGVTAVTALLARDLDRAPEPAADPVRTLN
ncbi:MFS transporter [Kitasatospora phosalacinea]|uniref:PhpN n=1 Tax=Kitasatospora phosalacinea TaxID=2065 RepID=A0A0M3WNL1_9ACTN|nr:MFS transporter [Kitasatospora phosalacinea]AKO69620.1 PhpN [Kitasatospora phosalacinea]